jgi:hypothetical protein
MEHWQAEAGTRRKQVFFIATPKASRANPEAPHNVQKATPTNLESDSHDSIFNLNRKRLPVAKF